MGECSLQEVVMQVLERSTKSYRGNAIAVGVLFIRTKEALSW